MFYSKKLGIQKGHLANMLFCSYLTEYIKNLRKNTHWVYFLIFDIADHSIVLSK